MKIYHEVMKWKWILTNVIKIFCELDITIKYYQLPSIFDNDSPEISKKNTQVTLINTFLSFGFIRCVIYLKILFNNSFLMCVSFYEIFYFHFK